VRILHYSLGFPPYRTGGMTKFCIDLMQQQKSEGNEVGLIWPGRYRVGTKQTKILESVVDGIDSYEVANPAPVPYDEGIVSFTLFMEAGTRSVYHEFIQRIKPDVIHIHTFMGIHENLLVAARENKVQLVFTTHDFFPICPKVTMFDKGGICSSIDSCQNCPKCNMTALPMWKNILLQSVLYRKLKNSSLITKLRRKHRNEYLSGERELSNQLIPNTIPEDYSNLRRYYEKLLSYMDVVHYNSTLTKTIYEKYLKVGKSQVISISHSGIKDNRREKEFSVSKEGVLALSYLGAYSGAKGFFVLKHALDELWKERQDFRLHVFFQAENLPPYCIVHGRYSYEELSDIMKKTDVLLSPSVWYETFGYTVLEALSYGVPVLISENVGAKDIVSEHTGIVVRANDSLDLKEAVNRLTEKQLRNMNIAILKEVQIETMEDMNKKIMNDCYGKWS